MSREPQRGTHPRPDYVEQPGAVGEQHGGQRSRRDMRQQHERSARHPAGSRRGPRSLGLRMSDRGREVVMVVGSQRSVHSELGRDKTGAEAGQDGLAAADSLPP